jgi:hypothetical protein
MALFYPVLRAHANGAFDKFGELLYNRTNFGPGGVIVKKNTFILVVLSSLLLTLVIGKEP